MEGQYNFNNQLKRIRKIGNGCQGEVFEVQLVRTGEQFALKIIHMANINEKQKSRLQFEVRSNLVLSQNSISNYFPRLYRYWCQGQSVYFLFELCNQGSQCGFKRLNNYCQRYNYLLVLLFDGLQSLCKLEEVNIIHRDIKPQNILRKQDCFKLADLGLSRIYQGGNTFTNNIGNRLGRSPQFITGQYSTKCDIWSLGVHIFYLLQNTLPFNQISLLKIRNNPNDLEKITSSRQLQIDFHPYGRRSKNALSFIHLILSNMIVINPDSRCSASYILNEYFGNDFTSNYTNIVRICLFRYLKERNSLGRYYLIILLAYTEFERASTKIKEDSQNINKIRICMKIKKYVLNLLWFLKQNMLLSDCSLQNVLSYLIQSWQNQCKSQQCQQFIHIDEVLQIYRIAKVKQKFPLIQWIVKLYKIELMQLSGVKCKKITLWDIPIDLYKLL